MKLPAILLTLSSANSIPLDLQEMAMNLGVTVIIESDEDLVSRLDQNPLTVHARFELLPYLYE